LPAGRECLSTEGIKKKGIFSIVSHRSSDLTGGVPWPPMREVREWRLKSEGSKAIPFIPDSHKKEENLLF
jgi:hypothetical protein